MPIMTRHYYIAHLLPNGTTEYLNCNGEFRNELTNDTISTTDAEAALALSAEHDALVLVTTDDSGFKPI
jgi:hypothetical protein